MRDASAVQAGGIAGPWRAAVARLGAPTAIFLAVVVVAAGISGVVLLAVPGSTGRYFSWTLRPPAAAALVGGFYLASAASFGWALTLPWSQVRSLVVAVLGLAVPTLVLTVVHDEVFDFDRWQALAWVALFATAPLSASGLLVTNRSEPGSDHRLHPWVRIVLGVLAVVLLGLAGLVWADGTRDGLEPWSPVGLVRLTGAYLGAWCSFLGTLCAVAAVHDSWSAARLPLVTLGLAATGALLGLLRTFGDLRHQAAALAVPVALLVVAVGLYAASRPSDAVARR